MPHTARFQPSKQLIDINKKKMDEAKLLLSQLEKKLQTATSAQMKEAILQQIKEIKRRYENYIYEASKFEQASPKKEEPADAQSVTAISTSRQATAPSSTLSRHSQSTQSVSSKHNYENDHEVENKKQTSMVNRQTDEQKMQSAQQILKRPHGQYQPPETWDQLTKSEIKRYEENDRNRYRSKFPEQNKKQKEQEYKIMGKNLMDRIGTKDRELKQNKYKDQKALLQDQNQFQQLQRKVRLNDEQNYKSIPDIDLNICKIGQNTTKRPEPIQYELPQRADLLGNYKDRQLTGSQELKNELTNFAPNLINGKKINEHQLNRFNSVSKRSENAFNEVSTYQKEINTKRFGASDYAIEKLDDSKSENNKLFDRVYDADARRSVKKSYVLPQTQTEIEEQQSRKYYKKFPQKKDLDKDDLSVIKGYLTEIQDDIQAKKQKRAQQEAYSKVLQEHDAIKKQNRLEEDKLDRYYGVVNYVPDMVKRIF